MILCSIDGCEKPVIARGWCWAHWARWRRNGAPLVIRNSPYGEGRDLKRKQATEIYYRLKHHEKILASSKLYRETHKEEAKLYRITHKEETRARGQAWRKAHPERLKGNSVKRRSLMKENSKAVESEAWTALLKTYASRCAYCGKRLKLEQDHITPIVKGGKHSIQNLVPACRSCNASKATGLPPIPIRVLLF